MAADEILLPVWKSTEKYCNIRGILYELPTSELFPSFSTRSDQTEIEHLAQSIDEIGLLQPLVVRPKGNRFEVVAGNRRFTACKLLGFKRIPCIIMELDDKSAFEVSLVENVQKRSIDPIDEGKAYRMYTEECGWGGVSELAKKIGKSVSYISRRMALLNLPDEIIAKIRAREIPPSTAEELLYLEDNRELSNLGQLVARRHLSMRKVREIVATQNSNESHDYGNLNDDHNSENAIFRAKTYNFLFDKAIVSLRLAHANIGNLFDNIQIDDWFIKEILLEHRNFLNCDIDLLIKQYSYIIDYNVYSWGGEVKVSVTSTNNQLSVNGIYYNHGNPGSYAKMTYQSQYTNGNPLTGMFSATRDNTGTYLSKGFTPFTVGMPTNKDLVAVWNNFGSNYYQFADTTATELSDNKFSWGGEQGIRMSSNGASYTDTGKYSTTP